MLLCGRTFSRLRDLCTQRVDKFVHKITQFPKMAKIAQIHVRVCPRKKEEFNRILKSCGLSISKAFEIFIQKTIINKGVPFGVSAETVALKNLRKRAAEADSIEEWSRLAAELTLAELEEAQLQEEENDHENTDDYENIDS